MRKTFIAAAILGAAGLTVALFAADTAREQTLQRGIDLMESKGDLAKAMPLFEDAARSSDRGVAARALLYLGQAQERQGADKARATYERIVKDFGGQTDAVTAAQKRLAALGGARVSSGVGNRMLCESCGDGEADFSPDGRLMVFTDWDNNDLAIRDMSSGQVRRLYAKPATLKDDAYPETPVFSPDQKQVAYLWDTGKDRVELRIMQTEPGAKPRTLLSTAEIGWYEMAGWFPDGKSVLAFLQRPDKTWELSRVSVSDGATTRLKSLEWRNFSRARFTPDGKYIVYSASAVNPKQAPRPGPNDPKDQHIWVLAADGSSEREIVKTSGINRDPVWTPDGKHVLFISDRSGRLDLFSLEVQNGKEVGIPSPVRPTVGAISPFGIHGGSYYYQVRQQATDYVNVVDAANVNAKPSEMWVGTGPAWSPDGKSVAFKRRHVGGAQDRGNVLNDYDLVVHSLETDEERVYATSLGYTGDGAPTWFHDSKSVMTGLHNSDGPKGVYRIDLKTGEWTKLPVTGGGLPALSTDDRTLYNRRNTDTMPVRIMSNDMSTGQDRQVFVVPGTGRINGPSLALSPDGRTLALAWMDRFPGPGNPEPGTRLHIGTVSVDGSNFREVFARRDSLFGGGSIAWSKDGRSIFFNQEQPGGAMQWSIMRVPADGSATASLLMAGPSNVGWFDLSPDGSRFVIGASKGATSEVWALDNVLSAIK